MIATKMKLMAVNTVSNCLSFLAFKCVDLIVISYMLITKNTQKIKN